MWDSKGVTLNERLPSSHIKTPPFLPCPMGADHGRPEWERPGMSAGRPRRPAVLPAALIRGAGV